MNRIILDPTTKRFVDTGEVVHLSKEHRERISQALKGRLCPLEVRDKISEALKGIPQSEEAKRKNSLANSNPSDDTRRRMSISHMGERNPFYGKQRTKEVKDKIREKVKARWRDPKFVEMMKRKRKIRPTEIEIQLQSILDKHFPNIYKYVGDFQATIGGRCPDFLNIDGRKEVIELFGSFWHKVDQVELVVKHYRQYGYVCIVIWQEELKEEALVIKHIREGGIHLPSYDGLTIFDYQKGIPKKITTYNPATKKFSQNIMERSC